MTVSARKDLAAKTQSIILLNPCLFSALAGALMPFGFAPFYWIVPSMLSVAAILFLWQQQTPQQAKVSGFIYGFAAFLIGSYWTYISVGTFGGAPVWLALIVMLGLVSIMAAYYSGLGYVLTRWFSHMRLSRLTWVFVVAALWTLMEWIRGWFLSGFPWLNLGYLSLDTPIAGYAPLGGVYFCTFVWVFVIASLPSMFSASKTWNIGMGASLIALFVSGYFLNQAQWTVDFDNEISVALIQGGVSQDKKWLPEQLPKTMELYARLSVEHADADLMVWPEAAIPSVRQNVVQYFNSVKARLGDDTSLLVGMLDRLPNENGDDIYNGLLVIDSDLNTSKEQAYYKDHLVPFGEYFPVPGFIRNWLRMMNLPYSDIKRGGKKQPVLQLNDLQVGAFICYEDAYTDRVNAMLPQAYLLVNISNDAWFGGSLAPHQHLQITRMRALETERPILRATNNGITAVIDKKGNIVSTVEQFKPQVLRAKVQPVKGATPFVMLGNWMIVGLCLLFLLFIKLLHRPR
ncbi:MAG: apolipoprotein N-acyltransferase [Gammaproteobacteria bacterium]|nr:apolipoprotein N-acyltransferase [Gammaproteobacteria bacterium]